MSRPTRSTVIRSRREAELLHPDLDPAAEMLKDQFDRLLEQIDFPRSDYVSCQLIHDGTACRQRYGDGWIMIRKDGAKGYIGGDCADLHFDAGSSFHADRARLRNEIATNDLLTRLESLLTDTARRERMEKGFERQQMLAKEVKRLRMLFPQVLLTRLHHLAQTRNFSVSVEFEYFEKIEDKDGNIKEVSRWRPESVGVIIGVDPINQLSVIKIGEEFRQAQLTYETAEVSPHRRHRELRSWSKSLEAIDGLILQLDTLCTLLDQFRIPKNLKLLPWLCIPVADRVSTVRAVHKEITGATISESGGHRRLEAWSSELSARFGGARFRIV